MSTISEMQSHAGQGLRARRSIWRAATFPSSCVRTKLKIAELPLDFAILDLYSPNLGGIFWECLEKRFRDITDRWSNSQTSMPFDLRIHSSGKIECLLFLHVKTRSVGTLAVLRTTPLHENLFSRMIPSAGVSLV